MGIFARIKDFIERFGEPDLSYAIDDGEDSFPPPLVPQGFVRLNTAFGSFEAEDAPSSGGLVIDPYGAVDALDEGLLMRFNPLDLVPSDDVKAAGDMAYRIAECVIPKQETSFITEGLGHDRVMLAALIQWMAMTWGKDEGFRNLSDLGRIVRHQSLVDSLVTGGPLPPPRGKDGDSLIDDLKDRDTNWHAGKWTDEPTWVSQATDLLADAGARTLAYARLATALDFLKDRSAGDVMADTDVDIDAVRNSDVFIYMPREVEREDERYRLARFWLALVGMIRD
ncbi:MAG: hypothetical protein VR70_10875 [Rhodospirillaceae bacterium BRH_c57]|nr:MAG: hypothetical protein VR70_10875 [Rhodospirillaceae bacterium BRH_c57]